MAAIVIFVGRVGICRVTLNHRRPLSGRRELVRYERRYEFGVNTTRKRALPLIIRA